MEIDPSFKYVKQRLNSSIGRACDSKPKFKETSECFILPCFICNFLLYEFTA